MRQDFTGTEVKSAKLQPDAGRGQSGGWLEGLSQARIYFSLYKRELVNLQTVANGVPAQLSGAFTSNPDLLT